jgi:hypothetical protein
MLVAAVVYLLQVWDATRCKQVKELPGHTNRVSSLAWNNAILSSGEALLLTCTPGQHRTSRCLLTSCLHL